MTLYFVGLGLGDARDITLQGLEIVKRAPKVFLESYTSKLGVTKEALESFYGREILLADREVVEKNAELLLAPAKKEEVVLLVVGDPFGATTHIDLWLRARDAGVKVRVIHNASILNAVGEVGLELYKYGKTTSIPYWEKSFQPTTPYNVLKMNKKCGLHTLCLLDIKADVGRYMTVNEGLALLQKMEERQREGIITEEMLVVGVARLGLESQKIVAGPLKEVLKVEFGAPLHSLIIPGSLHVVEEEALETWSIKAEEKRRRKKEKKKVLHGALGVGGVERHREGRETHKK